MQANMGLSRATGRALPALAMLGLLLLAATPAAAAASAWASTDQSQVRLISATAAVGTQRTLKVGVHVRLEPGWKTYWRSPGEAGLPPLFDWTGSVNLARAEVHWPAPKRLMLFGLETLGYTDEVIFPVTVTLARPGEATSLRLDVGYAICKDVCIPYEAALALDLPVGAATETVLAKPIDRYLARVPARSNSAELSLERVAVSGPAGQQTLEVTARADRPFTDPDLLVEGPEGFYFTAPEVALGEDGRTARLRVPVLAGKAPVPLAGQPITITIVDGQRALEQDVVPESAD